MFSRQRCSRATAWRQHQAGGALMARQWRRRRIGKATAASKGVAASIDVAAWKARRQAWRSIQWASEQRRATRAGDGGVLGYANSGGGRPSMLATLAANGGSGRNQAPHVPAAEIARRRRGRRRRRRQSKRWAGSVARKTGIATAGRAGEGVKDEQRNWYLCRHQATASGAREYAASRGGSI